MTGPAPHIAGASHGLAVLPMPCIDADALSVYARIADDMTRPASPIRPVAAFVRYGHAHGQVSERDLARVSASREGIEHTVLLGQRLIQRLTEQAMAQARALVREAGLDVPADTGLDLHLEVDTDYEHNLILTLTHSLMCRLGDLRRFMGDDLLSEVRALAEAATMLLTHLGPLCEHADQIMACDEFWLLQYACSASDLLLELAEEWACEGVPAWSEAVARISECAQASDMDADEAIEELAKVWHLLKPEAAPRPAKFDPDTLRTLAERAEALGVVTHPLIDYARCVARLCERLRPMLARDDAPHPEAAMMPLLMLASTEIEFDFADEHGQMMMQGDEGPELSVTDIDATPWATLTDTLACYYAQALAFEALPYYGLCDSYHPEETSDD